MWLRNHVDFASSPTPEPVQLIPASLAKLAGTSCSGRRAAGAIYFPYVLFWFISG